MSLAGNKAFFVRPWHTYTAPKRLSEAKLELLVFSLLGRAWFREAESTG